MKLNLTEITLNYSINHIEDKTTDRGVQVGIFLLKTRWHFQIEVGIVFSHTKPYNFAATQWLP